MRRILLIALALTAAMLLATAAWGQRAGAVPTANIVNQTPSAGEAVAVEGEGWDRRSRIEILFDDEMIGTTTTDFRGRFSTEVGVPGDASEGEHVVTVRGPDGEGNPTELETQVTVTGTTGFRGSFVLVALLVAALALILIVAAILLLRRRGTGPVRGSDASRQEPSPLEAGRRRQSGR